ncbi:hypothetical protein D9M68_713520 [compost metagenome]
MSELSSSTSWLRMPLANVKRFGAAMPFLANIGTKPRSADVLLDTSHRTSVRSASDVALAIGWPMRATTQRCVRNNGSVWYSAESFAIGAIPTYTSTSPLRIEASML